MDARLLQVTHVVTAAELLCFNPCRLQLALNAGAVLNSRSLPDAKCLVKAWAVARGTGRPILAAIVDPVLADTVEEKAGALAPILQGVSGERIHADRTIVRKQIRQAPSSIPVEQKTQGGRGQAPVSDFSRDGVKNRRVIERKLFCRRI